MYKMNRECIRKTIIQIDKVLEESNLRADEIMHVVRYLDQTIANSPNKGIRRRWAKIRAVKFRPL